jgi:cobalt-zinc-cadmium efflux system membrane fusion protein
MTLDPVGLRTSQRSNRRRAHARSRRFRLAAGVTAVCGVMALAACRAGAGAADSPAPSPAATAHPTSAAHVTLDASQIQQVRIETLSTHAPEDSIRATGTVEFNADRMARILPPVSGQVHDLAVNVGDTVSKDGVLFVLSSREVAAAMTDHLASHKDLDLAEKTYAMTKDLFEHQAASHMSLQQSESELAKAKAKVQQTEEVLQVLGLESHPEEDAGQSPSRIPVRTPIAGTVIERNVTDGQFVGPDNPPLITIADLSNVWVQADVFERDMHSIAVGQKADVTTTAYPDEHFIAQVSHIGTVFDAQTRTAKVRVLVANRDLRLKPGMFISVSLSLPNGESSLTVPSKAVFVENSHNFVYLQGDGPTFVRREVETVARGSDRLRVIRGLVAGDRVVSDGVLLLRQLETDAPNQ